MIYIYNFALWLYKIAIRFAACFNAKARSMYNGWNEAFAKVESLKNEDVIWVHAASLGEFEQGRPLMDRIRKFHPEYKILLTFFSPSGYEVRKNYPGADVVTYLPIDTPKNVDAFISAVRPKKVFFVKYEFWLNYLNTLRKYGVETYIISAIFREKQVFFAWYGEIFRRALMAFRCLYLQNNKSEELLQIIDINSTKVVGDTRFDRVADIAAQAKKLPILDAFAKNNDLLVVGSSWQPDEEILFDYINNMPEGRKVVIAPHHVEPLRIKLLTDRLTCNYALYTETNPEAVVNAKCLIINTIGLLSSIYSYGKVAYVGGGFGVAVHNTLEAAVWGMPVVFGPNFQKFNEIIELIACHAATPINSKIECEAALDYYFDNPTDAGIAAKNYVMSHIGATDIIYHDVFGDNC